MSDVTQILAAMEQGDPEAGHQLLPIVYDELRRLAGQKLAHETPGQTLQATALVHEAYLRLVGSPQNNAHGETVWHGRAHFFAAAAEAMRRILIDKARHKNRQKHGGDWQRVELDDHVMADQSADEDILAVDAALTQLTSEDPDSARIVQLHFFAGLSIEQTAEVMGISRATAYRQWAYARAWLRCAISGDNEATQ